MASCVLPCRTMDVLRAEVRHVDLLILRGGGILYDHGAEEYTRRVAVIGIGISPDAVRLPSAAAAVSHVRAVAADSAVRAVC